VGLRADTHLRDAGAERAPPIDYGVASSPVSTRNFPRRPSQSPTNQQNNAQLTPAPSPREYRSEVALASSVKEG